MPAVTAHPALATPGARDDTAPSARPIVAVYRDRLLIRSETYIRTQGETLRRYRSHYVCMRRVAGLELPDERVTVLNRGGRLGRLREIAFKATGLSPTLERELRRVDPALVHAHLGVDGAAAMPLARRLGLPLVVTFHGYDATADDADVRARGFRYRAYLRRREALKRDARLFIAVSEFTRGKLLRAGFPESKLVVHYIGVDTEQFRPDPTVAREPVVLFVGRLIEKKGAEHLVAAMREVQAQVPDAELVIAGRGPLRGALEAQAREAGVRARFLGAQRPDEVTAWMARARVLCIPSVTAANGDTEGLPIVLLEALAMGVPVVASRSAGIPEAITDGETGLVAAEGDRAALARHIRTLLTDSAVAERIAAAALRDVRERFDVRRQAVALEALYDSARVPAAR
jgi:glycosyltransferase involved in cell wall biosynthesis